MNRSDEHMSEALAHSRGVEAKLRARIADLEERLARADADARQTHEHLRLFVEHTPAAVAMLDRQMRYLVVSRRWLEDYGLSDRNLVGVSHYEVFPDVPDRWREAHRRCLAGERLSAEDDAFERADGTTDWVRWELVPWRDMAGEVGGALLLTEVVTARKRAELALRKSQEELEGRVAERTRDLEVAKAEAERANAFKSRFLAAASHDLRQPLQSAGAYLAVLGRQLTGGEQKDVCDRARRLVDDMGEILEALLDLSRLESGAIQPRPQDFDLKEMLERALAAARPLAERKGLTLSCSTSDGIGHSDPALLARVIDNLVSNAVRYTDRGEVALRSVRHDGIVTISVSDTGMGIPTEALNSIFDEYVQLDNPARDRRKGLGLGLSIAKYIANALGHRIAVRSTLGAGSTFTIEIPAGAAAPGRAPAGPSQETPATRHPVVLLVEDDPAVAASTVMLLHLDGFEAHDAGNGPEALEKIAAGLRPDVVVSDYRLPGYDGLEVIRRVRRALGVELPAVLMTGDAALQGPAAGDFPYTVLHKPVPAERLSAVIWELAAARAPARG